VADSEELSSFWEDNGYRQVTKQYENAANYVDQVMDTPTFQLDVAHRAIPSPPLPSPLSLPLC
jgi:hypothetical protein